MEVWFPMVNQSRMRGSVEPLKLGSVRRQRPGARRVLTIGGLRRTVQLGFAGFIIYIAVLQAAERGSSTAVSPEAFCPFGGLEGAYRFITSGGQTIPHTHLSNLVLAAAFLVTAFLARSAFCGWICPLGFLQELTSGISRLLQRRVPAARSIVAAVSSRGKPLAALDRSLRLLKYAVLLWSLVGAAYFGVMVFRDFDPWAALITIATPSLGIGTVVLTVTLVASLFVDRPWCRYACPLGAVGGLVARMGPIYLKRESEHCKGCAVCSRRCPMGLDVHSATTIKSPDCIGCLECLESCPREGALDLRLGLPGMGK